VQALTFLAVVVLIAGCSTRGDREHEQMMDQIEQQITLPHGAEPLNHYVRYYAGPEKGLVSAIYMLPGLDELAPGEGCEDLKVDGSTAPCKMKAPKTTEVGAGNRVWRAASWELPMPMRNTGKCGVVSVVYALAQRRVLEVACFGQVVNH
jgi:hypothetical protein